MHARITCANEIDIDFSLIPEHVKLELATATHEFVENVLRQPGAREKLNAYNDELKALKARLAAKKAAR